MKKLLSLAFCAAATAAFAADEITLVDEVGVTMVTLPAGQTNTIIAVSFTDFDTGNVSISNLVKTTSLAAGDEILLYTAKDTYSAWKLDANKVWQKAVKTYTVDGNGVATESVGDDPATTTATVGTGLWIVRKNPTTAVSIAIYGKYTAGRTSSLTADAWNLVGNAGLASYTFTTGAAGDRLIKVNVLANGARREYRYDDTKGWTYSEETITNVKFGGVDLVTVGTTQVQANPTLAPGEGFWYYTTHTGQKVSWKDVE